MPVLYIPVLGENTFADRYLYLPSIGFVILISTAIERIYSLKIPERSANYIIISILIILTGLYSVGTIKRNYIWKDNYSLWTDTTKKSPDGHIPQHHMGDAYYKKGEIDKAFKHYQIALKLMPDSPETHGNLGNAYAMQGKFDEALKEYTIALRLKPNDVGTHYNIGNTYYEQRRFDEAINEHMMALKLKPDYPEAHNSLGNVYLEQERFMMP